MITVEQLIQSLKEQNPKAPVKFWHEDKGYVDVFVFGQNQDEISYQIRKNKLTKEQASSKVFVEINEVLSW